jgi:hypothetical protein
MFTMRQILLDQHDIGGLVLYRFVEHPMANTNDTEADDPNLTVGLHTRVSREAKALLAEKSRADGIRPATLARQYIYRGLGLIGKPKPRRRGRR